VKKSTLTDAQKALRAAKAKAAAERLTKRFRMVWEYCSMNMTLMVLTPEHHPFHDRKHRIDFAHLPSKVAIEIEGGIWSGGRHTRGEGFEEDCYKYNRLTMEGWAVIRLTSSMLDSKTVAHVQLFILRRLEQTTSRAV